MIEQATIGCLEPAAALGAEDPPEAKDTVAKRIWIQSRPGQAPNPFTKTYIQVGALTVFLSPFTFWAQTFDPSVY